MSGVGIPLLQTARQEARQLLSAAPPSLSQPPVRSPGHDLLQALLTTHRTLSAPLQTPSSTLDLLRRQARRCGRRLEDLLDGLGKRAPSTSMLVTRFIEPDLLPLVDALAVFLGGAARADGDDLKDVGEAVAVVVEEDLGGAVLAAGLYGFEVPRPGLTMFDPRRHQLVERAAGKRDVVVDVLRCGRIGAGGRLLEPSHVIIGAG